MLNYSEEGDRFREIRYLLLLWAYYQFLGWSVHDVKPTKKSCHGFNEYIEGGCVCIYSDGSGRKMEVDGLDGHKRVGVLLCLAWNLI